MGQVLIESFSIEHFRHEGSGTELPEYRLPMVGSVTESVFAQNAPKMWVVPDAEGLAETPAPEVGLSPYRANKVRNGEP